MCDDIKIKRSFRRQFLFAALIITVFFIVIYTATFAVFKQMLTRQYVESEKKSIEVVANNIDFILSDVENVSNSILTDYEIIGSIRNRDEEKFIDKLHSHYISSRHIEGISVITPMGFLQVGIDLQGGIQSFPRFELNDTNGEIVWFPTKAIDVKMLSKNVEQRLFSMGRKMIDIYTLNQYGYMNIEIDERVLLGAIMDISQDNSNVYITDMSGNIITSLDENYSNIKSNNYFSDMMSGDISGDINYSTDRKNFVAIYSICNYGDWYIVKTIPEEILFKDVNKTQIIFSIILMFLLVLMIGFTVIYVKRITEPIEVMIKQMKEVEEGNLDVRVESNIYNELDDLSESFNHMVNQVEKLMDEMVQAEQDKSELELEVLYNQINPHFLYNTLNTIRWMAIIKGESSIAEAILALVKLLRISMSFGDTTITIEQEIEYIENYLVIQKLRFNQMFNITYNIKEVHKNIKIPKLILQPIIENSLIHGIDESENDEEPLFIEIFTRDKGDDIEIIVKDNGQGIEKETLENVFNGNNTINRFNKVGLNNVNQRIKLHFGDKYGLQIHSSMNEGTTVIILIPNDDL